MRSDNIAGGNIPAGIPSPSGNNGNNNLLIFLVFLTVSALGAFTIAHLYTSQVTLPIGLDQTEMQAVDLLTRSFGELLENQNGDVYDFWNNLNLIHGNGEIKILLDQINLILDQYDQPNISSIDELRALVVKLKHR